MSDARYGALIDRVIKESGAKGRAREDLRRELESHLWEAAQELRRRGVEESSLATTAVERFGSPEKIGTLLSLMHSPYRRPLFILGCVLFAAAVLLPGDQIHAFARYHDALRERYLDIGWYYRAVELQTDDAGASCDLETDLPMNMYVPDGVSARAVPSGYVITTCSTRWLMLKFLPPIQIAGPRVTQQDVLHIMKMEGGLRSYAAAHSDDRIDKVGRLVLDTFLHALAVGAGNAPTEDAGVDEPEEFGEEADRAAAFREAAALWGGDLAQLADWNPTVDPTDAAALFQAACTWQLQCFTAETIEVERYEDDGETVVFTVLLQHENPDIAAMPFTFWVTRREDGYPNDVTDDRYVVTDGYAYVP